MKALVIYFSRAAENYVGGKIKNIKKGNTEVIAEYIKHITNADLFKVERLTDYPKDYKTCVTEAEEEQNNKILPELKSYLDDVSEYDTIFIGGPIYWGTYPQPIFSELKRLNLDNKIILPFSTHEGSGLANVVEDIKKYAPNAIIKPGLAVTGSTVGKAKDKVEIWIKNNLD